MQVLIGVSQLIADFHDESLVHRNVTPNKLLYFKDANSSSTWKFSRCTMVADAYTDVAPGVWSIAYVAPETLEAVNERKRHQRITPAVDAWSLGVISCSLLCKGNPFSMIAGTNDEVPYPS